MSIAGRRATVAFPGSMAAAVLVILYAAFFWASVASRGVYDYAGVDLRGFYASAQIVRDHGFAAVYDLDWQAKYQRPLYQYSAMASKIPLDVNPTPYLPPFVAVFLLLLPFDPVPAFGLWLLVNLLVLLFYLRHFVRAAGLEGKAGLALPVLLSLPVFFTLFFGQVNVFLLICLGESLICFSREKDWMGGAWLAGLLLKPQVLILFIPGLILRRNWRGLGGFALLAGGILFASLLMVGMDGMRLLLQLMTGYISSQNLVTNFPQSMMNWRALALNLDSITNSGLGWVVAIPGMVLTGAAGLALWVMARKRSISDLSTLWLGTLAATATLAWHSHTHTALVLLAPMIVLSAKRKIPEDLFNAWVNLPAMLFVGIVWIYTPIAIGLGYIGWVGPSFGHIVTGFSMLLLNLVLLGWSLRSLRHGEAAA